jgi:hypothetical protein
LELGFLLIKFSGNFEFKGKPEEEGNCPERRSLLPVLFAASSLLDANRFKSVTSFPKQA